MLPETRERIIEMIDRLERHKAAAQGLTDLKIGMLTVANDYAETISLLLDLLPKER